MTKSGLFFSAMVMLWVGTALYFVISAKFPPLVYDHNASIIEPTKIKRGGEFRVARTFTASRDVQIYITRVVAKGDCRRTCEILDVSQGYSYIEKGDYLGRWRYHEMPVRADAGKWTFIVTVYWTDMLGVMHSIKLKPLEIEVVE